MKNFLNLSQGYSFWNSIANTRILILSLSPSSLFIYVSLQDSNLAADWNKSQCLKGANDYLTRGLVIFLTANLCIDK